MVKEKEEERTGRKVIQTVALSEISQQVESISAHLDIGVMNQSHEHIEIHKANDFIRIVPWNTQSQLKESSSSYLLLQCSTVNWWHSSILHHRRIFPTVEANVE